MFRRVLLVIAILFFISGCTHEEPPPKSDVTLKIVYPPELTSFMHALKAELRSEPPPLPIRVDLELQPEYSLSAVNKISTGELKAEGSISPHSALTNYTNSKIINLGARQVGCRSIFSTPLLLAVRDTFIENFKENGRFFSWRDFMDLTRAASLQSGQEYIVSYAVGMPQTTASGLGVLMQLAFLAQSDSSKKLELKSFQDESFNTNLQRYISKISYYAPREELIFYKTGVVQDHLFFSLTSEQQLINYNRKRSGDQPPLYALYPNEGMVWLEYSLCFSEADWVTAAQRGALKQLSDYLLSASKQRAAIEYGFRAADSAVSTAAAYSSFPAAGARDIVSPETTVEIGNGVVKHLIDNEDKFKKPLAAVYLFDISGSTESKNLLSAGKRMMRALLSSAGPKDLSALITFSDSATLASGFSHNHGAKIRLIDAQQGSGGSSLYDAVNLSIKELTKDELKPYRKVIYLFTDGNDNASKTSIGTLIDTIRETRRREDISAEFVGIQPGELGDVERIARAFNGTLYKTTMDDIDRVVADLSASY